MTKKIAASVERQLERGAKHRLAVLRHVEEVSGNVAATCRYYGISRQAYYGWLKRYEAEGEEGLRDRSSAPHHSPTVTNVEVVEKILWLRQQYHFGPQKIAMYLKRYHDLTISSSGVWRILHKVGLGRLPASKRYKRKDTKWKRYEKQRPGHALQVDVKFIEPLGQTGKKKRYYQYTVIDDCTRLRILRAYPTHDQKTAIGFIDHVLSKLPVQSREGADRQRVRVRAVIPLAPARQRHRPHLHQTGHAQAQRESRTLPPDRRRGVPPAPRRPGHRRRQHLQRQAPRMGGLLQLSNRPHGALAGSTPYERPKQKTQDPLS
jgi:transposase